MAECHTGPSERPLLVQMADSCKLMAEMHNIAKDDLRYSL